VHYVVTSGFIIYLSGSTLTRYVKYWLEMGPTY